MQSIICQRCGKRPATMHLTERTVAGAVQELHLCATCIQQLGLHLEAGPPPIAVIMQSAPVVTAKPSTPVSAEASAVPDCPSCGGSFSDFESAKRFGCAHEYHVWEEQVSALLIGYHGTDCHVGRQPDMADRHQDESYSRRLRLDAALRQAVASEDYESAARLRDEIRQLDPVPDRAS